MRICLVSSSFYPATFYGGPISATWDLSKKLAEKGIQVYISTTNANGSSRLEVERDIFIKKQNNLFVKYYHEQLVNRFSLSFLFGIWGDIKSSDVVYIQYLFHYTVLLSLLFGVLQQKKIFICPRGSFSDFTLSYQRSFLKVFWIKLFVKPFCKYINWHASSYLEKSDIKKRLLGARVEIINDGVDFSSFQGSIEYDKRMLLEKYTKTNFKEISHIFFSIGRLHKIKGFGLLVNAFSIFLQEDRNAKLLIAGGDDGEERKIQQQIIDLELQNSVFLIGSIGFQDKKILLNNIDYFTLASEFESFGIVIAEALACGRPIVLSNKTPWRDLEQNKCGILVDTEKNSFSDSFSKIVNGEYSSEEIKTYVRLNYDWSVIIEQFIYSIEKG